MLKLKENVNMGDGLFVMRGNVKIFDGDKIILDKDNAITNVFRKILMTKLFNDILVSPNNAGLNTITTTGTGIETESYINSIKFGIGSSSSLGAKSSKEDVALVSAIPTNTVDDGTTLLYINTDITRNLNINFDYDELKITFTAELINNDTETYILGELGVFTEADNMLTHLFFDPIYFEPDTTKKIVYTIYLY